MSKTTRGLSYYTDSSEAEIETAKDSIRWLLQRRKGTDMAISSSGLAEAVGKSSSTVRSIVRQLRREADFPIGYAHNQGYYRIVDVRSLEEEVARCNSRIEQAEELKQNLVKAFNTDG